ncbi:hypothetical protein ACLI4Z_00800 [Natrialbaceae archaeon A-arb3/5]
MVKQFRRQEDVDGCACLECRNVRSGTMRRRLGDILLWAVGFLRTHPSVPLLFLALAVVQFVGHLSSLWIELALAPALLVGGLFARSYTSVLAAGSLSNRRYTRRETARYTLRRLPTVLAIVLVQGVATMALLIGGIFVGVLMLLAGRLWFLVGGILGLVAIVGLLIVVWVKFVLAMDAALVGGYGPIASLRVSWGIVSFRRRTTILLVGLLITIPFGFLLAELSAVTDPYPVLGNARVRHVVFGMSNAVTFLSTAVTALVFCHVYVQGVLD